MDDLFTHLRREALSQGLSLSDSWEAVKEFLTWKGHNASMDWRKEFAAWLLRHKALASRIRA